MPGARAPRYTCPGCPREWTHHACFHETHCIWCAPVDCENCGRWRRAVDLGIRYRIPPVAKNYKRYETEL